jgi:hypothetical protein
MNNARIRRQIRELAQAQMEQQWEMAELLCRIFDDALYKSWGYSTMEAYLDAELDMRPRSAQYLRRIWAWHLTLPLAGQKWARSQSTNILRRFVSEIDVNNWHEWRRVLKDIRSTVQADKLRRGIVRGQIEIGRDLRSSRATKKTAGMPIISRMCVMRTMGMSVKEVADALGVKPRDVRSALRMVQLYIPLDLHERLQTMRSSGDVNVEIINLLLDWFSEPVVQGTGTTGRR